MRAAFLSCTLRFEEGTVRRNRWLTEERRGLHEASLVQSLIVDDERIPSSMSTVRFRAAWVQSRIHCRAAFRF